MRRSYKAAIAGVTITACLIYYWYGGTPRVGGRPQFPGVTPVSIDIAVLDRPAMQITDTPGLTAVMEMLRAGRSVKTHMCKARGHRVLHLAEGEPVRVNIPPGHNFLRYEFGVSGGLFGVSRALLWGIWKSRR